MLVEDVRQMMQQDTIPEDRADDARPELLESIEAKLESLMELKRKSIDLSNEALSTSLDEDSVARMMGDFEDSMRVVLRKEVLEKIVSLRHDAVQFEDAVQSAMAALTERVSSHEAMKEAIQSQMTVMTVSLEKTIGSTVTQGVEELIRSKINEELRNDVKQDLAGQLVEVRDFILNRDEEREQKTQSESLDEHKLEEVMFALL